MLLAAGVVETRSLLRTSLYRAAQLEAGREARLAASLGLAAALSTGPISRHDLRLAATDYAVIRRDIPLTGAVVWKRSGSAVFSAGRGQVDARRHAMSSIARKALRLRKLRSPAPRILALERRWKPRFQWEVAAGTAWSSFISHEQVLRGT
jgi:hypothetical protein